MAQAALVKFHRTWNPWHAGGVYEVGPDGVPEKQADDLVKRGVCAYVTPARAVSPAPIRFDPIEGAEKRERSTPGGSDSVGSDYAGL